MEMVVSPDAPDSPLSPGIRDVTDSTGASGALLRPVAPQVQEELREQVAVSASSCLLACLPKPKLIGGISIFFVLFGLWAHSWMLSCWNTLLHMGLRPLGASPRLRTASWALHLSLKSVFCRYSVCAQHQVIVTLP